VAERLEPAPDARVAPGRALLCHADDQRNEIRLCAWATRAARLRAIVFLRHQCPIPPQDRVRCDDTRDGRKPAAAENLAFQRQAASLVVGETEPLPPERRAQNPVVLDASRIQSRLNPFKQIRPRICIGRGAIERRSSL